MSPTPLARLDQVQKRFGQVRALDGLSLEVNRGEMLALLGPNGAGKSTAISLLLGLQTPDGGSAELFGAPPHSIDARRRIGVMMQEVALSPVMHPREMIAQVASYYPTPYSAAEVIQRLSLEKIADRQYGKLSGGQKRQVQFGMAVAGRAELLFLDEPSVGLDVQSRDALWQVLRDLLHEGVSIVLTTHYLEEAEALADRVAVVTHGRLVASGSVDQIRAHVTRKNILCRSGLAREVITGWPEVLELRENSGVYDIATRDAEAVLRRLLAADATVRDIEVKRAGLSEAFTEITSQNGAAAGKLQ